MAVEKGQSPTRLDAPTHQLLTALRMRGAGQLIDEAAAQYMILPIDIFGRARTKAVVAARRVVWNGLRKIGWSYPEIGRAFGRDHTTIMSLLRDTDRPSRRTRGRRSSRNQRAAA